MASQDGIYPSLLEIDIFGPLALSELLKDAKAKL
jgi:hypothetical protein